MEECEWLSETDKMVALLEQIERNTRNKQEVVETEKTSAPLPDPHTNKPDFVLAVMKAWGVDRGRTDIPRYAKFTNERISAIIGHETDGGASKITTPLLERGDIIPTDATNLRGRKVMAWYAYKD